MVVHCRDQSVNMASICEEGHMEHPVNQASVTINEPLTGKEKEIVLSKILLREGTGPLFKASPAGEY